MRVAIHPARPLLALLHAKTLRVFDLAGGAARELASVAVAGAHLVVACEAYVAVVTGKVAPAGASLSGAKLRRFSWSLEALGECKLGEVERHNLTLSADGARAVATDWKSGRVTVFDAATGARVCDNGRGIPSGASFSPEGKHIIAGSADQGSGDILFFEVASEGAMPMERLPPPKPGPGLDDAPYFSRWSRDGRRAVVTNETWGGRGLFVYDTDAKKPAWSVVLDPSAEESEEWFAFPATFAAGDRVLIAGNPGALRAYAAADGAVLGELAVESDGREGFVIDEANWLAWTPGPEPVSHALPRWT